MRAEEAAMTTAEDLRDLRDAIESISTGALPRWGKPTTKTGEAAIKALAEMYKKYVSARITESSARVAMEQSLQHEDNYRTHSEILTDYVEKLEKERDNLKEELKVLREAAKDLITAANSISYECDGNCRPGIHKHVGACAAFSEAYANVKKLV